MLEAFQEAFLGENAQDLGPEEAYALYEEFQELTPAGQDGNRLIESLADRLSAIGAYDIAAELLDQQLQRRLQGTSRARTALKVALLYILDGQYERARQRADAASRVLFDVNAQIARDARLLDAYGLHRLGRTDAALTRLAGDVSRSADLLRLEINWEAQDYREGRPSPPASRRGASGFSQHASGRDEQMDPRLLGDRSVSGGRYRGSEHR